MTALSPNTMLGGFNFGYDRAQGQQQDRQNRELQLMQMAMAFRQRQAQEARQQQELELNRQQETRMSQSADDLHQNRMQENLLLERKVYNRKMLDQTVRQALTARDAKIIMPEMADQIIKKAAITYADDPTDILMQYHREQADQQAADRENRMGEQFRQQQQRMNQFHEDQMQQQQSQAAFKTEQEATKVQAAQQKIAADQKLQSFKLKQDQLKTKANVAKDSLSTVRKMWQTAKADKIKTLREQLKSELLPSKDRRAIQAQLDAVYDEKQPPEIDAAQQNYDAALQEIYSLSMDDSGESPGAAMAAPSAAPQSAPPGAGAAPPQTQPATQPAQQQMAPLAPGQMGPPAPMGMQATPEAAAVQQALQILQKSNGQAIIDLIRQGNPQAKDTLRKLVEQIMQQGAQQ